MCFTLYLSSDSDLEIKKWDPQNPKVALHEMKGMFAIRPKHLTKKNVYSVSSSKICGCGFRQENDTNFPDSSEIDSTNKDQFDLFELVNEILKKELFVELFGCWSGGEDNLEFQREISVNELIREDFYFNEDELIKVTK